MKILSIRKEDRFIPEFNGNKELPEADQVVVNIKSFPTVTEASGYKSYRYNEGGGVEIVYPNDSVMLARHIGAIKNIDLGDDYDAVNNGSSLGKTRCLDLSPLVSEIREYLLDASEPIEPGEN